MTRSSVVSSALILFILAGTAAIYTHCAVRPVQGASVSARSFEFIYQVHFPASPEGAGSTRIWIPLPQQDGYQDIRDLRIESPIHYALGQDSEYRNPFAVFTPTARQAASGFDVTLRFTATRLEHLVPLTLSAYPLARPDPMIQRYLQPDKLVPLNGPIAELAKERTAGAAAPLDKARRIYDYVIATMRYDKSGQGWGRGDAIWACTSKRGNCTDFHSLFIGMMRASGIPARFEIGFPLPEGKTEGDIPGYHCWAEFYIDGIGWIPVDASEAWKNPTKRDYFFGAHDTNRVFFTYGRDIRLSAEQKGDPLNYFIYPYAETSGQPVKNLQTHFSFRDVSPASQPSAGR